MKNDFKGSSRSNYRAKRKKTNFVLNGLIGIVILLIAVVGFSIFSGNGKTSAKKDVQTASEKTQSAKQSAPKIKEDKKASNEKTSTESSSSKSSDSAKTNQQNDGAASSTNDNQTNSDQVQTVDSPDGSTTAPATAPASSSGQHVTSYDSSSQDWQQMLQAMSSATGIDQGNMTVWFLGSDRSTPGGSVGTISAKDNKGQKYKVYLQWNGQGYTATRVEQAQ